MWCVPYTGSLGAILAKALLSFVTKCDMGVTSRASAVHVSSLVGPYQVRKNLNSIQQQGC